MANLSEEEKQQIRDGYADFEDDFILGVIHDSNSVEDIMQIVEIGTLDMCFEMIDTLEKGTHVKLIPQADFDKAATKVHKS